MHPTTLLTFLPLTLTLAAPTTIPPTLRIQLTNTALDTSVQTSIPTTGQPLPLPLFRLGTPLVANRARVVGSAPAGSRGSCTIFADAGMEEEVVRIEVGGEEGVFGRRELGEGVIVCV